MVVSGQPILASELDGNFKFEVTAPEAAQGVTACFSCGTCTAGCLIHEVHPEYDPRKIARMINLGMRERVLSSDLIWLCVECETCSSHCPQNVKFGDVIGILRGIAVKEGYVRHPFFMRFLLQSMLPFQKRLELVTRPLVLYQRSGMQSLIRNSKLLGFLSERLKNLEYMLPPLPLKSLRNDFGEVIPAKGERKQRVGFFPGCIQSLIFAPTSVATVSVLTRNSCEVVIPKGLKCCGMAHSGYGEFEQARKLAKNNIKVWESTGTEVIVTDCATCGSFLKGYKDLLKEDPEYAERAAAFSQKIQDISEFLIQSITLKQDFNEVKRRVTYHDPCHLVRGQNLAHEPRHILNLIPNLELIEMKEADSCCGGAGTYNIMHYDLSMQILDRKMTNIAATEADLVATCCPGCQMQLGLGVKLRELKAKVVHPIQLLDQAYRNAEQ